MTTLEDLNNQSEEFFNEMEKRNQKLKVNSSITQDSSLFDLIYGLEDEVYGKIKIDDCNEE